MPNSKTSLEEVKKIVEKNQEKFVGVFVERPEKNESSSFVINNMSELDMVIAISNLSDLISKNSKTVQKPSQILKTIANTLDAKGM